MSQFQSCYHHHIPWLSGTLQGLPILKGEQITKGRGTDLSRSGHYNKIPCELSIVVYNFRNLILTFLEAEKFEIKVTGEEPPFSFIDCHLSPVSSHGQEALWGLFYKFHA